MFLFTAGGLFLVHACEFATYCSVLHSSVELGWFWVEGRTVESNFYWVVVVKCIPKQARGLWLSWSGLIG